MKRPFKLSTAIRAMVPILVLSLAVCGKDTLPSSEDIDPRLAGSWGYFGDKSQPGVYIFNQNGSFVYYAAIRMNYLTTGSRYAMEAIYKGNYQTDGNSILFSNVFIARFDRTHDNDNRNRIGDREHAKEMLNTTTGFSPWTFEPVEFNFIEPGVVRIAKKDDEDEIRTTYRADWENYDGW